MRQIVTLGSQDTLEEKTVTVCFGADFVNVSFINFCATRKEIAQVSRLLLFYQRIEVKKEHTGVYMICTGKHIKALQRA